MPDLVDVEIESVDASGDGVARHGRTRLAVAFAIPGELVRVRMRGTRAGVRLADLVEVLRASPHRVPPACRHFGPHAEGGLTCGGCAWQHIAYHEQLRLKTRLVTDLVRGKVPPAPPARPTLPATQDDPWHYRNKLHFIVQTTRPTGLVLGHYARFSRRVVPVRECPVHDARGNDVAFAIADACRQAETRAVKGIAVRCASSRVDTMATLVVTSEDDKRVRLAARRLLAGPAPPTSLHVNVHPRDDEFIFGARTRHVAGPERMRDDVDGVSFLMSPTSFFQTNVRAAEILVRHVLAAVPSGAHVLDLYAGAGLFALPLARRGHAVVAIEANRSAVADGEMSRRLNRIPEAQCRFIAQPVEIALGRSSRLPPKGFDVAILDPPREGCAAAVVDGVLGRRRPRTAVYVSCDPQSLARDLARITALGYAIESMQPIDMFPHTPHIETVVVIQRKGVIQDARVTL